ncbi:hypothetical protein [Robbsia andropogonis]|uniref:hypothetical protein n=1 Tax=Robbsia andropogonis TaxID=28092 RepID=UPI0004B86717|nr:hypothetical protein [Robbsia andropogonis]
MKKFAVVIEEVVRHTIVVMATTEAKAQEKAEALLLDGQGEAIQTDVTEREFIGCEPTA